MWAPDYVDAAAAAEYARLPADDPYVAELATAAARAVDGFCNRQFGQLDAPGTFTYDGARAVYDRRTGRWMLEVDDIMNTTGLAVTVNGTTVTAGATGYQLWERNAVAKGYPHTHLLLAGQPDGDVDVLARFGWSAVPASVIAAVRFQVNRWAVRRESPYGTAGSPSEGSELKLSAVLDPDTRAILAGGRVVRKRMPR